MNRAGTASQQVVRPSRTSLRLAAVTLVAGAAMALGATGTAQADETPRPAGKVAAQSLPQIPSRTVDPQLTGQVRTALEQVLQHAVGLPGQVVDALDTNEWP
ncbi:hypothetical protein [Streptomyces sp. NPDC060194]|uniref:hypothetical protein n=1 Tax=Streptomyces sp. NPDC060194 TaxID=3347069 RepID=UPI0036587A4E